MSAGAGGIHSNAGTVTLNDSSSVSTNETVDPAGNGGGIRLYGGTLTLNDSSSVTGNRSFAVGGGISAAASSVQVTLNDFSSVTGNISAYFGGGIESSGTPDLERLLVGEPEFDRIRLRRRDLHQRYRRPQRLLLGERELVQLDSDRGPGRHLRELGRGMSNHGSLTLNDSASVAGNTTSDGGLGGGINSTGALTLTDSASVLRNTAGGDEVAVFTTPSRAP